MAQRVQVVLEDDLDGGKADETVTFGLDGTTYEIDLSKKNAAKLRDALSGYVGDRYAFAVLQNGPPLSSWWARRAQDRFLTALASSQ